MMILTQSPRGPIPRSTNDISYYAARSYNALSSIIRSGGDIDGFCEDVRLKLSGELDESQLNAMAAHLLAQFHMKLEESDMCMLRSYSHRFPSGQEKGTFIALDVGGSTLRIALVELQGSIESGGKTCIKAQKSFPIDDSVKSLKGVLFFDWIASRVQNAFLNKETTPNLHLEMIPLGLSWSFPVEQHSLRDARMLQMGKGFCATDGLLGHNLADVLEKSFLRHKIHVRIDAIVNDSTASFLADSYRDTTMGLSVLLGTGLNAAVCLPSRVLTSPKFACATNGLIDPEGSKQTLINTELSLFGGDILMASPWDEILNMTSSRPDFQPFEHRTSGRYIGELVRLILITAVQKHGLFNGVIPASFGSYQLDTPTVAVFERDETPNLREAQKLFTERHPLPNGEPFSTEDLHRVREITKMVTDRAAALIAMAIFALSNLKYRLDVDFRTDSTACISCSGSVLEYYPSFISRVQQWLDRLSAFCGYSKQLKLQLSSETESALVGAAVAAAAGAEQRNSDS